jgi:hypothetical protein
MGDPFTTRLRLLLGFGMEEITLEDAIRRDKVTLNEERPPALEAKVSRIGNVGQGQSVGVSG